LSPSPAKPAREPDVDFFELWQEKLFLGQEFLTWLWLSSEVDSRFELPGGLIVEAWFEKSLRLESGFGASKRSVACQCPEDVEDQGGGRPWAEAFAAVMERKKMSSGRLRIKNDNREWLLNLPADTLTPTSIKLVSGANFAEDDESGPAGQLLDRAAVTLELLNAVEALFAQFLKLRLSADWTTKEVPRLQGWLKKWRQERQN
jgi:recombination associated protein RdgC